MPTFAHDPLNNAIQNGIKADIEFNVEHCRYRAALILMLSGIDAMACLDMPFDQNEVRAADYIAWVNAYLRFPCKEQLTGEDVYSIRCAMLHSYGMESKMTRNQRCRKIGWMDEGTPEVRYVPSITDDMAIVSIRGFKNAFFAGVDKFLVRAFSDPARIPHLEARLEKLVLVFPHDPNVK